MVRKVRSFNRTVTQRIGALQDEYLSSGRPLGASRLLWEIGEGTTDVRSLRARLDLDSGYLSRLLRTLEEEGLVAGEPDPVDRRVRRVRLTTAGEREHGLLDERSDELAKSVLDSLRPSDRERLVDAMDVVTRLLTAGLVEIAIEDPHSDAARFCLRSYFAELDLRFDTGFDPGQSLPFDAAEMTLPAGLIIVARLHDEPVGCGALRFAKGSPALIKRMWVSPTARGLGVGRRLLAELERRASDEGATRVRLDTNGALHEAIGLYRSSGYVEVESFNDERYADHWFEKRLGGRRARRSPAS